MSTVSRLFVAQLRRDRWQLLTWVMSAGLLMFAATSAVKEDIAAETDRRAIIALAATNPAFLFLRGVPDGVGFGAVLFFQMFVFLAVMAGLFSTFLVVRHSRADEDLGRAELLGGTGATRTAPLVATLILAAFGNAVLAGAVTVGMLAGGLGAQGALLTGVALAATGLVFAGMAAVFAQLLPTSRGANGAAGAIVGAAYLVRGVGDALASPGRSLTSADGSWLSWLSPIAWGQRVGPFSDADVRPLLLSLVTTGLLAAVAVRLRSSRDLGAGLLRERPGHARAGSAIRSSARLAFALHRPTLIGWTAAAAVLGIFAGALAPTIADAIESNAALSELIRRLSPSTRGDAVDIFATAMLGLSGVLAAASGVQSALRLRTEETEDRAELLLATPLSRGRWMLGHLTVASLSVAVVALSAGLSAGLTFAATEFADRFGSSLVAAAAHMPAALVFVGVVAVVFSLAPSLTIPLAWGLFALGIIVGQFGDLLRLPEPVQAVSPFAHSPSLPADRLEPVPLVVLSALAVLAALAGVAVFRGRDLRL